MSKKNTKPDEWMPFYVAKYLADTMHFDTETHGAYCLLLFHGWMHGGHIPDDDRQLSAIVKLGASAWRKLRPLLAPKFDVAGGVWRQKRLTAELEHARRVYASKVENGSKGGRPRTEKPTEPEPGAKPKSEPKQKPAGYRNESEKGSEPKHIVHKDKGSTTEAVGNVVPINQSPIGDLSGSTPDVVPLIDPKAQRLRILRARAVDLLAFLNEKTGRNFEPVPPNVDPIVARLKEGFDPDKVRQVIARKVRQWAGDEKMAEYLRPKTLFNATNFANYAGEIVDPDPPQEIAL